MRGKIGLAEPCLCSRHRRPGTADPLQIRGAWVAPLANWSSIWLAEKGPRRSFRQILRVRAGSLCRHAADDHGDRQQRAGDRRPRLSPPCRSRSRTPAWTTSASSPTISRTASHGYNSTTSYEVLADGPIKKIEDLKGKIVATNAMGSGVDIAMRAMLRKHGLEANRDYTVIEAPFPAMKAMLAEKKVDLIPAVLPFSLDPEMKKIARHAVHQRRSHRRVAVRHVVGAQAVHRRAPRRAGRFSRGHTAHRALVSRPEEPRRRRRRSRRSSPSSRPSASAGCSPNNDYYRSPTMMPNLDALQKNVDMTKDLGFVQRELRRQGAFRSQLDRGGGKAV